jgi:AhpD family alkylhydroperoxidase
MREGHYHDVLADLRAPTRDLRQRSKDVWAGFGQLHAGAMAEGALPVRTKELIALAIAVIERCDGCIAAHARAAASAGASDAEVADALGVALLMGGGPASVYAPRAWDAYQEFRCESPAARSSIGGAARPAALGESAALLQRPADA